MKDTPLYNFVGSEEQFESENPQRFGGLYFPLANEQGLLSAIAPNLGGDIKLDQHSFLTIPVAREDLHMCRAARNFWISVSPEKKSSKSLSTCWAINGESPMQRAEKKDAETVSLKAGLLWHEVTRTNKKLGLEARTLNFVPAKEGTFEIMMVEVKNISKKTLVLTGTSAIPLYARSADNLRDHRHVTALLHRLDRKKYGLNVTPTMTFNEAGHKVNSTSYYIVGVDGKGQAPVGLYPTLASFIGESGDLVRPEAIFEGGSPQTTIASADQGKEAMGALQFSPVSLAPDETATYILFLGINREDHDPDKIVESFGNRKTVSSLLEENKKDWKEKNELIQFETGDPFFNQWIRWVLIQPTLRKIYGNSYLPDFDYGRGGRGWRDLWQDCLALLLANPQEVRGMILNNFSGVRIDGSNATIVGRKRVKSTTHDDGSGFYWEPEFIADRNNVTRTWMDHGTWPFLTTELYINQTGDWDILLEKAPYFRDAQLHRCRKLDVEWMKEESQSLENPADRNWVKTKEGHVYQGSILEHILIQTLIQFFNVGEHNVIRLEDADWNDGMDMGRERGESVAFTWLFAGNMEALANLLETVSQKKGWTSLAVAEELILLVDRAGARVDYNSIENKTLRMKEFFSAVEKGLSGGQASIPIGTLIQDLRGKASWMKNHLNQQEWTECDGESWFNGYYDNQGRRVEGKDANSRIRMTLTGQVYPVMTGMADEAKVEKIISAVNRHLWDEKLGGLRLNTNFGDIQLDLGRAFSFAYGEKENGAVFSHMVVMYANALYQRGHIKEGFRTLNSLYALAKNCKRSRIFPGIPEYFNNEGRGLYHYLTGSASWYIFTLLTEVFGVRGKGGNLLLAPKLVPEQFDKNGNAVVCFSFANARMQVTYQNPKKVSYEKMRITAVVGDGTEVPFSRGKDQEVLIQREILSQREEWKLEVKIEEQ